MNYKIILAAVIWFLALVSCTKEKNVYDAKPAVTAVLPQSYALYGEDEDHKILMKVFATDLSPVSNAKVMFIYNSDTVNATTDVAGHCLSVLPESGEWDIVIEHPAYLPYYSTVDVVDSFTEKSCALQLR